MTSTTPSVVVVMPTYNERENLPLMVDALRNLNISGLSMLVVDDNSPDGTGQLADQLAITYPGFVHCLHRPGKAGLGKAYIAGYKKALEMGAECIIAMDMDFSHPPETLHTFLDKIKDYDLVVGSRYTPGGRLDERWGITRRFLSWGGNFYARMVTGLPIRDATGGFKCFRRTTLAALDLDNIRSEGYGFQVELHCATHRKGFRLTEVPIYFKERELGTSKMSMKIVLEAFWRVLEIRLRY